MTASGQDVSKLSGYAPALPTPFDDDGNIDSAAFDKFCDCQIQEGATAHLVCGTTGEAATLSPAEHRTLVRIAAGVSRGRLPVIAGAGSNSTNHAIELTQDAQAAPMPSCPWCRPTTRQLKSASMSISALSLNRPHNQSFYTMCRLELRAA
jgi:Dihydrodipicolinate synthetase family